MFLVPRSNGAAPPEGALLDLHPSKEAVLPSHPTLVAMRRDPNRPRVRRAPVVRTGDAGILCDIERALAMQEQEATAGDGEAAAARE